MIFPGFPGVLSFFQVFRFSRSSGNPEYSQSGRGGHPPCQHRQEYAVCCWPADLMGNVLQSFGGRRSLELEMGEGADCLSPEGNVEQGPPTRKLFSFFRHYSCITEAAPYTQPRLPYLSKINLLLCSVWTLFSIDQPLWRLPAETHTQIVNAKSYWHVGRARQEDGGSHHVANKNGPKLLRGGWVGVEYHALTAVHAWLDWSPRTLLNMQLWPINYSLVWLPTEARQSADVDVARGRSTFINWLVSTLAWPWLVMWLAYVWRRQLADKQVCVVAGRRGCATQGYVATRAPLQTWDHLPKL